MRFMNRPAPGPSTDVTWPLFIVTVDTEEDGLWSGRYPRDGHTTENLRALPVLGGLLADYGLKGTYLVSYPVVRDPAARDIVSSVAGDGNGEVGSHLHSWCCPPYADVEDRLPRYPHCLPPELQLRKLRTLSRAIEEAFGEAPVSYRAGRWGFDASSLEPLRKSGHRIDSSVVPGWWQKGAGAPDFARAPEIPYRPHHGNALEPGDGAILEVPVTAGLSGMVPGARWLARAVPPRLPGSRTVANLLGHTTLRPALHDTAGLLRLVELVVRERRPVINLMLHSSEVAPGHSPYSQDEHRRDELLMRTRAIIEAVRARVPATPATLGEAGAALSAPPRPAAPQLA
jgi:hypothetical protein